jgi:hypothetical protein
VVRESSAPDRTGHTPFGINLAVGALVTVGATMVAAAAFSPGEVSARLLVVAVAVGGYAVMAADVGAAFATALLGFLLYTGFLANQYGTLTWDGASSVRHLLVLALPAGLAIPSRWIRTAKAEIAQAEELDKLLDNADSRGTGRGS